MTTDSEPVPPDPSSALRLQILATEHWGVLATRSLTWSEVMSRITIHLTVCSASLVVLALVVQADGFGTAFKVLSVGLASAMLVLGTLTGVRVTNASLEDQSFVAGMNRLRAGYVELDPGAAPYLVASWREDGQGVMETYSVGTRRSGLSHVLASTSFFINTVNAIVAGTFATLIVYATGGGAVAMGLVGGFAGIGYLGVLFSLGRRRFRPYRITQASRTTNA
jgi:hypothetical protein